MAPRQKSGNNGKRRFCVTVKHTRVTVKHKKLCPLLVHKKVKTGTNAHFTIVNVNNMRIVSNLYHVQVHSVNHLTGLFGR
jgi:hypothetical protein